MEAECDRITAWELGKHGFPHTVIMDNAGGHLMQNSMVDLVIVGTDRTTRAEMEMYPFITILSKH